MTSSLKLPLFAGLLVIAVSPRAHAHEGETHQRCGLLAPDLVARAPAVPTRPFELPLDVLGPPRVRRIPLSPPLTNGRGSLSGKTVYLSAGHGWTWQNNRWETQRPTMEALVEDLVSAETMTQFLIPYLRNMGAYVVPVRDPDFQTQLVIVDDEDATLEGQLDEQSSPDAGWGPLSYPISGHTNPFDAGGTRLFSSEPTSTGRIVYAPSVPETGHYNVYVSYIQADDRASDAHYIVRHAGGESHYHVDQRRHGMTWVLLGRHWFEEGASVERASVVLSNESADAGAVISTDAVRFGAGVGRIDRGGGANDRPMWENNCRYNAQLAGAPPSVFDALAGDMSDDIAGRGRFAAWDHEPGEDAIYVAWHTNGSVQRGTESFTYSPFGDNGFGTQADFTGVAGSLELQDAVHDRLIAELRQHWDPEWINRGKKTAYFGEVNPANNSEMPSVLLEVAFHDHPTEADSLREPRFRQIAAAAIARGIADYFADKDGVPLVLPPETPIAVRVQNDGAGGLTVSWRPPTEESAPVTGYRIYSSDNGYGFDDGRDVDGETLTLSEVSPGDVRYVRVAALNAGGESLPSEVVGARVAGSGHAPVLVVGGFDRLDAAMMPVEDLSSYGMAPAQRMRIDQMNDGSYAARHGAAIAGAGFSFDGATDDAVHHGDLALDGYTAVDWFGGEVSFGDEPFTSAERDAIGAYVAGGGRVFVSGSELAWTLDLYGEGTEPSFYRDVLKTLYAEDDSETYGIQPVEGPYAGMEPFRFDDEGPGTYDAEYPDTFMPGEGATAVLEYDGGIGGIAAIAWLGGPDRGSVINFGFPFETIAGAETRIEVMRRTLEQLGVEEEAPIDPGTGGGDQGGAGAGAGGSGSGANGADDDDDGLGLDTTCACTTAGRGAPAPLALLALAFIAAWARRSGWAR